MMYCVLEIFLDQIKIKLMDNKQAYELCASYLIKEQGKKAILKHIDFVQSICAIKDKDILKKLENLSLLKPMILNESVMSWLSSTLRTRYGWNFVDSILENTS